MTATRRPQVAEIGIVALLFLSVAAVYYAPTPPGQTRAALDYLDLHAHRIQFARQYLFGAQHRLPAWYPRELLGTPFWSNIQSFPFLPTRLLLLPFDPDGPNTYQFAVILAAELAAVFAYMFCRRIELRPMGSAATGWTFACCGFFASRVTAGHLPLLEVYCGLPLLLWLVESAAQASDRAAENKWWIAGVCIASVFLLLGGHPQLPTYAFAAALVYGCGRGGWRLCRRIGLAMICAVGCAAFALLPMLLLTARSTRLLALAWPDNDLALPLARLFGFFAPWHDGEPDIVNNGLNTFHGYPTTAYFWDTFIYIGWLPWISLVALAALWLPRRRAWASRPVLLVALLGAAALVLSLPPTQLLSRALPGTFLRSPARLVYVTEFSLSLALGVALDALQNGAFSRLLRPAVAALLVIHAFDLGTTSRAFICFEPRESVKASAVIQSFKREAGSARIGIDLAVPTSLARTADDAGFFDSIMLARPYRFIFALAGAKPSFNTQSCEASQLNTRALEAAGLRFLVTFRDRPQLAIRSVIDGLKVFELAHTAPRCEFFPDARVCWMNDADLVATLRNPDFDPHATLLIPGQPHGPALASIENLPAIVEYDRPSPDVIRCAVNAPTSGYLRVIESFDPGWRAAVDGKPTEIVPAMSALLAVKLPPGRHTVMFEFHTPGAVAGGIISGLSITALGIWIFLNIDPGERQRLIKAALKCKQSL